MPLARALRIVLIISPALGLLGAAGVFVAQNWTAAPAAGAGGAGSKLVVVAVFDQLRGDYVEKWAPAFGPDGFARMKRDGVWYSDAHLPHACSSTGPGHASIATGAPPSAHGIVENTWFIRGREKAVYCASGDVQQRRVPPAEGSAKAPGGLSPERLLTPTVGDALKAATGGKGRSFSLALKDRAAVLMGGLDPAGVYCFDTDVGEFHTSAFYRDKPHPFLEQFTPLAVPDRWHGKTWDRLRTADIYNELVGPDDGPGEGTRPDRSDRVFPHALAPGVEPSRPYYNAVEASPFGNELLWEFAKAAIAGERLGQDGAADILWLGFSSNDMVGHAFGPDSHEVLDITLRTDKLVGEMIAYLDEKIGAGKYTLIVTSDHGICPMPEVAVKTHPDAQRINPGDLVTGLEDALDDVFGRPGGVAGRWVEKDFRATLPWLFFNRRWIEANGFDYDEVEKYCEQWVGNRPAAQAAFGRKRLIANTPPEGDAATQAAFQRARLAFHPDRCGDLYALTKPYVLPTGTVAAGTNHGTPHAYDTHVPILVFGAGVPAAGKVTAPTNSLVVAAIASHALGIPPPAAATEPLPPPFAAK